MSSGMNDRADLPFLPPEWLRTAEGIARYSLGAGSVAEVLPEHRKHVLSRVHDDMGRQGVVPPENWAAALAEQCGWDHGNP